MTISHHTFDIIAAVVLSCSVLSSILPPYEVFNFSPTFQSIYRILLVFIAQIGAINLRSLTMKLYPSYHPDGNGSKNSPSDGPEVPPPAISTH